jgi:hypothetical protein
LLIANYDTFFPYPDPVGVQGRPGLSPVLRIVGREGAPGAPETGRASADPGTYTTYNYSYTIHILYI